jgi:apolipoprotein D and lipocalin family protein
LKAEPRRRIGPAVLLAAALVAGAAEAQPAIEVAALSGLEGTWYEIAAYGSGWPRGCVRDSMLMVSGRSNIEADLRSRCRTASGLEVRTGRLRADGVDGFWRARFAPALFGWLPAAWDDFWVLGHDPGVTWLAVGERHHRRLAVFSRTVALDEASLAQAMGIARRAGFDPDRLVRSRHDPDEWRNTR